MRSVVVVLPASIWAMMPIFLHRSNGTCRDTDFFLSSLRDSCSLTTEPVKSLPFLNVSRYLVTSDSVQKPYWPPPCGERLPFSLWPRRDHSRHPVIHCSACRSCPFRHVRGRR